MSFRKFSGDPPVLPAAFFYPCHVFLVMMRFFVKMTRVFVPLFRGAFMCAALAVLVNFCSGMLLGLKEC